MENSRTKIRFWSGLRTIGGTIISVEYKNSRVIFDFGLYYNPAESFSALVKTRYNSLVEDYINLNKIPAINGLYSKKDLRNLANIIPAEEDETNTVVLVSHLHLDHIGAMGFVSPNIPVFMTEDSLKVYKAFEEVGEGVFGDREYSALKYDEAISIGDIRVTAVQLDHDILGACGFLIETPDLKVVYSGDLRLHGKHPERTKDFALKAHSLEPDLLLMEGTMINTEKHSKKVKSSCEVKGINTEEQVKEMFIRKFQKASDLIIINMSERNLERITDIIGAAEISDRKIILEPETAYLIANLTDKRNFAIYKSEELKMHLEKGTVPEWIKRLMESYSLLSYNDINLNPKGYILQNSFKNLMELLDLNLKFSVYIHSNAVPLGEYDPDLERLLNFLRKLKVEYEYIGTPGHAIHSNLKCIIDEIKPKILIPIHSFYPEKLYPENKIQFIPEYDVEYMMNDGKLIKLTVK